MMFSWCGQIYEDIKATQYTQLDKLAFMIKWVASNQSSLLLKIQKQNAQTLQLN